MLHISLDILVVELSSNETPVTSLVSSQLEIYILKIYLLDIKDGVLWVGSSLILSCVTNQPLAVFSEGNIGGSDTVPLIIDEDFDLSAFHDTNTSEEGPNISSIEYLRGQIKK